MTDKSEIARLHAVNAQLLAALKLGVIQLEHVRIFATSREKMSPTGVALYDELLAALRAIIICALEGKTINALAQTAIDQVGGSQT